jgi:hypothetical protein
MGFITAIMLLVIGVLGAASLIVSKRPDAKEAIAKMQVYQGWIGVVAFLWGVWGIISAILNLGMMKWAMILWVTALASSVIMVILGLLLGLGVMKTFVKDESMRQKLDDRAARLAPKQGTFGLIAIGLGIWLLLVMILGIGVGVPSVG